VASQYEIDALVQQLRAFRKQTTDIQSVSGAYAKVLADRRGTFGEGGDEGLDKASRTLASLISAAGACMTLEDRLETRIEKIKEELAATVGTAEDMPADDSRSAAQAALEEILGDTARLAHSYLAARNLPAPATADAREGRSSC